jgi:hypothetical protein
MSIGVSNIANVAATSPEVLGPKAINYPAVVDCLKGWSFRAAEIVQVIESKTP